MISTLPVSQVLDRLISAAVAEFQFIGPAPVGKTENLVAEADAENGFFAEQLPDGVDNTFYPLGVAGAVGEKDAIRVHGQDSFGIGGCGDDLNPAAFFG